MGISADGPGGSATAVSGDHSQLRTLLSGPDHESGILQMGSIFTDDQMAAAMIDRLAHHGQLIVFEGKSYRLKHTLMRQK